METKTKALKDYSLETGLRNNIIRAKLDILKGLVRLIAHLKTRGDESVSRYQQLYEEEYESLRKERKELRDVIDGFNIFDDIK